ncbi:hypothetical protein H8J86_07850 [Clostridium perfringens]|uniref:hypothetical protein n=1 Tax=Clostridium perfringens TaxID=1502 RepID=UPI0018E48DE8|nr:hypothetical protein [Clostridium perfringens]MBI6005864.1 hypothetical protein [Clostridium perfringens]
MNKRIEKIVEKVKIKGNNLAVPRRDQVRKAIEENAFDYMVYQGYDEVYDVKPVEMAATLENIADYWLRNGDMWASIKNNCLDVTIKYGYSYIDLFVDLKEDEEQSLNTVESKEIEVTYNEEKNGIEVKFNTKPAQEVINDLKANGFRWHSIKKIWYAKQTKERREFVNNLISSNKDNLSTENKIKPFTSEEMEEANKVVDMIVEMDWELLNVEINEENNCIYGNVKKSNGIIEKEGLYAPSDDLHELDGVYRCLKGKIVNNISLDDMEDATIVSTLCEENNVVNLEDYKETEKVEEENFEMEMNFDDILESFENVEIKNENRLCSEDLNFLEDLQEKFNNAKVGFKKYIKFYRENKLYDLEKKEIKISCDSLEEYFVEKVVFRECEQFIYDIYNYFEKKYNLELETIDIDKDYSLRFRPEIAEKNLNWFMEILNYNIILDNIFNQLEGVSFKERGIQEIKNNVVERTKGWNETRINIKGKNLNLKDYLYFDRWDIDRGDYKIFYSNESYVKNLLKLISLYENGEIDNNLDEILKNIKQFKDVTGQIFKLSYEKVTGIKFYKNGKVQLIFNSGISALEFAKEYLNYKEVA